MTETGHCVDAMGKRPEEIYAKWDTESFHTEDGCFKLCFEDPYLTGCTFLLTTKACFAHTGDIKRGNGDIEHKCYYRKGINFISFRCFDL